jgi:hypothetical protein
MCPLSRRQLIDFLSAISLQAAGNGVVAIRRSNEEAENEEEGEHADRSGQLWVGDAQSFVEVVDLETKAVSLPKISTNGNGRADELAYDPHDHILVVANDRDTPTPFVTFIDTRTRTNLGRLLYPQVVFFDPNPPGSPGVKGHGLEQPVWDAKTRRFDISYTGDEIWFNPGDERVYFGGGLDRISVPVLDTDTNALVTTLTVGHIFPLPPPPQPPNQTTHSVAADAERNRIFVPVGNVGVKVYTDRRRDDDRDRD